VIDACHSCIASPSVIAVPTSVLLTPSAPCLPSSSDHESMPSLPSSSALNGAPCPFLYVVHSSLTPRNRSSVSASRQGEGQAPRMSHLWRASSPWGRMAHTYKKSRKQRLDQRAEETSGDEQLPPEGRCRAHAGLLQKRGVDGHLCRGGEQSGSLGVAQAPAAFLRGTGIVQRHLVEIDNTDCSGGVFLV
jgi:hypothetical protein